MHQGRFKRNLPHWTHPTLELIAGSSQTDSYRPVRALKSHQWPPPPQGLLGIFHGQHQTVAKVSDNEWRRSKVTDERVEDDVPTAPWLTRLPGSTNTDMHVIFGKDACLLFQDFHHCRCIFFLTLHHGKWSRLGLIASNVVLMWSRCFCSSTIFLTVFPLFPIYSSLIKSYPQAWGRHEFDQYAPLHSSLSFI